MSARESGQHHVQIVPGDRLLVVANPATRRDVGRIIEALRRAVPKGVTLDVRITTRPNEATELARHHASGARMVIAVGGDGTVAEVASGVIDAGIPLAILPGGSTNIIAKELRIPAAVDAGVALLSGRHRLKAIDAGTCDGRVFLHMAGVGFDSRFFARSSPALKRKIGSLAYIPAAARTMFDGPFEVRVKVDNEEVRATSPLVLVANGRSVMHPALTIAPEISSSDGQFDVFVVTSNRLVAKAGVLGRFLSRHLDRSPDVRRLRGRRVEIASDPPLPVELDGDVDGMTPVSIELMDQALQIIVPDLPE